MNKPRGLGRGLGALFPVAGSIVAPPASDVLVRRIEIERIKPNPQQPRRSFDEESLTALAASIRTHGILAPIIVRPHPDVPDSYEIVTGERRWRAARLAGHSTIAAIVRDAPPGEAIELAILENVQRTDLNPIEEAAAYRALIEKHDFTQEIISQRIGKSRPAVANALRLLALPDAVQALVRDGVLSAGHARTLAALPHGRAQALATEAVRHHWTVRELERKSAEAKERKTSGVAGRAMLPPDLAEAENRLRFALATRVSLHPRHGGGGTIEVHYADDSELTRILDHVAPHDT
ncbi:MAG TPA: ParB/RepB/Spo0J family partition protein [Candidatus Acidoferrales bacterium]|nr:ParB/RepB/Spo0J family partition protein [Candidatus Acidoferrales bacterium]